MTREEIPKKDVDMKLLQAVLDDGKHGCTAEELMSGDSNRILDDCCGICDEYLRRVREPK